MRQIALEAGAIVAGRFLLEKLLRSGQGVSTFLGRDLTDQSPIIIKISGEAPFLKNLGTLEAQASILNSLPRSYFSSVRAVGREGGVVHLVVDYLEGEPLSEVLARRRLDSNEVIELGRNIARLLGMLHGRSIWHRDIKPSNILISKDHPPRHHLIDFGLARTAVLSDRLEDQPVGAATYISPEQAGLIDGGTDARSDLYSLGVVLYECVAGEPPFTGSSLGEILRQHLTAPMPEPNDSHGLVPTALLDILRRLLAKDPRDRYQTAAGLKWDLDQLHRRLSAGAQNPDLVIGTGDQRQQITEPSFIGRESEMRSLLQLVDQSRFGQTSLVLLEALSGGGKSRFLDEAAHRLQNQVYILRGQGVNQTGARSLQILQGVIRDALAVQRQDSHVAARLRKVFSDHGESLTSLFPEYRNAFFFQGREAPAEFGEIRVLEALCEVFQVLGSATKPTVIYLDDCQWADELFFKFIDHWNQRRMERRNQFCTLVLSFRSEEVSVAGQLRKQNANLHLKLPPLDVGQLHSLMESMAGPVPEQAKEAVLHLSGGSPFMATAVLRGMAECGAIRSENGHWRADTFLLGDVQSSMEAAAFLVRRMELLPPQALDLLTAGAILGKNFQIERAAALGGLSHHESLSALSLAKNRGLVWDTDDKSQECRFVHDKLREALLERLPPARRQELHRLAALRLEEEDPDLVFELAFHFDAAGDVSRALPYALEAAERAKKQYGLWIAEEHYRIALRGAGDSDRHTLLRLHRGLAEVLMLRGNYQQVDSALQSAQTYAQTDTEKAAVETARGELAFKTGDMDLAAKRLCEALRLLGRPAPRSHFSLVLELLGAVALQALHTIFPGLLNRRRLEGELGAQASLAMVIYSRLAYVYWFKQGKVFCAWAHLRNLNLAETYPPSAQLAQAYSEHGPVMTMLPWFSRGIQYARKSYDMRTASNDRWGQGQSLHFLGVAQYGDSRYVEAFDNLEKATELLDRTGDRWERNTARWHAAYCLYRLGNLKEAERVARETHREATALGDYSSAGICLSVWAKAAQGIIPSRAHCKRAHPRIGGHPHPSRNWPSRRPAALGRWRTRTSSRSFEGRLGQSLQSRSAARVCRSPSALDGNSPPADS
ncbi:protein kinase [bacterium]|nr:protein kinase [bacterium]